MYRHDATLAPTPPCDFGQSLAFLRGFSLMRGEQTIDDDCLTRALVIDGETVVFRVVGQGTIEAPSLRCALFAARPLATSTHVAALDRVAFFLSIADDLAPFYAIGGDDPAFAPVLEQLYGYHQVKFLTPFENAAWAIVSQRVQMPVARKMWDALVMHYGTALTVEGTTYRAFPPAERLAIVGPDVLAEDVPYLRKAEYLHATARAFDDVDEEWLRSAPYDDVRIWLLSIPGIGAWSASFVLIRALGRMERISHEEALLRAAIRLYGLAAATPTGLQTIADRYGVWQGYWAHYLRAFRV